MNFSRLWLLNFLWLLPLFAFLFLHQYRQKDRALAALADPHLLKRLVGKVIPGMRVLKSTLFLCAASLMIFAMAGPRWGSHYEEVSRKGVDIMLALDVSASMLVKDVDPDRFERAKREIMDLLKVMEGDRAGLVIFAGSAFVQCPLTLDYSALMMFLNSLEPGMIPARGTDLGSAIDACRESFNLDDATDKVIMLFTDGEDNEAKGEEAARLAASKGVRIFVFGIGTPEGGPIPQKDGGGGFIKDKDGNVVISRLEEQGLVDLAAASGGLYARSDSSDMDLDRIYFDGVKIRTEAKELKSGKIKVWEERFYLFLLAAFFLLFLEGFLKERKRGERV